MKDVKNSLMSGGYSQEEAYFYEQNKMLIEEIRKRRAKLFELGKKLEAAPQKPNVLRKKERAEC